MSKQEKRYFKLFASIYKGENSYIKLFNYINKNPNAKDSEIKLNFQKEKWIKNYSSIKSQLYGIILKTLKNYYENSDINFQINSSLLEIEILISKGLLEDAKKKLLKLEKKIKKYEYISLLPVVLELKLKIIAEKNFSVKKEEIIDIDKELDSLYNFIFNNFKLDIYNSLIFNRFYYKGKARDKRELLQYKNLINNIKKIKTNTFRSNFIYHNALALYYSMTDNYSQSEKFLNDIINILEKNPKKANKYVKNYISTVNNLTIIYAETGKFSKAFKTINKLKKENFIFLVNNQTDTFREEKYLATILYLHLLEKRYDEIIKNIFPGIINFLNKNKINNNNWYNFYFAYNLSYIYFVKKDYKNVLKWTNFIINELNYLTTAHDIVSFAKILKAIVFFETGDEDALNYFIHNTDYFLKTRKRKFKTEEIIINLLKQSLKKKLKNEDYINCKIKLNEIITNNVLEKQALRYFDFLKWIETKLHNHPIL